MGSAKVAGLLLAAGAGSRFGGRKLLAEIDGVPIGRRAALALADVVIDQLIVIAPPDVALQSRLFGGIPCQMIENTAPEEGLSRSLKLGMKAAAGGDADAALICLADMPFVTPDHLRALITAGLDGHEVVASSTGEAPSPPALFARAAWPAMESLEGDQGARDLLQKAHLITASPQILSDIDTIDDLLAAGNPR